MMNANDVSTHAGNPADRVMADGPDPAHAQLPQVLVWVVDDNDQLRKLITDVLGQQVGIQCARDFSSPDALLSELASKPGPDVILLDVQMGDRNGLDAVRPIKSLTRSTRVFMFTTCFNSEWRERALGDGAADYLLKSEAMEKVAERIRCPAKDSAQSFHRRRPVSQSRKIGPGPRSMNRISEKTPQLFRRTLNLFRALWN